jgi:hypothetical protein
MGKVYIFACEETQWPIYVGQTKRSVGNRVGGAFKCTPDNRANGFAGYRFKRERTSAFLHVFLGDPSSPWTSQDAECIEAEVVFRIRAEQRRRRRDHRAFQTALHGALAVAAWPRRAAFIDLHRFAP